MAGKSGTGREAILTAAAELFSTQGYTATSTRDIAAKVGIKQPSLYYHFAVKDMILEELLMRSASPSVAKARALAADPQLGPVERLTELARFDTGLLLSGDWNLGALYLLPEVTSRSFPEFARTRTSLFEHYVTFIAQIQAQGLGAAGDPEAAAEVVFTLIEGVILRRARQPKLDRAKTVEETTGAVLRILGLEP